MGNAAICNYAVFPLQPETFGIPASIPASFKISPINLASTRHQKSTWLAVRLPGFAYLTKVHKYGNPQKLRFLVEQSMEKKDATSKLEKLRIGSCRGHR